MQRSNCIFFTNSTELSFSRARDKSSIGGNPAALTRIIKLGSGSSRGKNTFLVDYERKQIPVSIQLHTKFVPSFDLTHQPASHPHGARVAFLRPQHSLCDSRIFQSIKEEDACLQKTILQKDAAMLFLQDAAGHNLNQVGIASL